MSKVYEEQALSRGQRATPIVSARESKIFRKSLGSRHWRRAIKKTRLHLRVKFYTSTSLFWLTKKKQKKTKSFNYLRREDKIKLKLRVIQDNDVDNADSINTHTYMQMKRHFIQHILRLKFTNLIRRKPTTVKYSNRGKI